MSTGLINYDRPVADYIDRLSRTEHVTHTQHRKDVVTLHHNGGRLSLDGLLSVWTDREASAHLGVDAAANVGQFVRLPEYAWATGNTEGNVRSISIEMANETLGPEWKVGEKTWREAARLAGWIHARVFGWRPTKDSLVVHHYWSSTACAGPFVDRIFDEILKVAQTAYAHFRGEGDPTEPDPSTPPSTGAKSNEEIAREAIAGWWGNGDERRNRLQAEGYNYDAVQDEVNRLLGNGPTPEKTNEEIADEVIRGLWGNDPQRREDLTNEGYDASAIQALVNIRYGAGAPMTGVRPGMKSTAAAVIRGEWGNGEERKRRLQAAGYDYATIQAEVNKQLGQ
jgi:Cpl-7 lysozyme-like protein/N-acetylmuramoyl-L-alanine amidase-like protein